MGWDAGFLDLQVWRWPQRLASLSLTHTLALVVHTACHTPRSTDSRARNATMMGEEYSETQQDSQQPTAMGVTYVESSQGHYTPVVKTFYGPDHSTSRMMSRHEVDAIADPQSHGSSMEGVMIKATRSQRRWQKRHVVLKASWLLYYHSSRDLYPAGVVPLADAQICLPPDGMPAFPGREKIANKHTGYQLEVRHAERRPFLLHVPGGAEERDRWVHELRSRTGRDDHDGDGASHGGRGGRFTSAGHGGAAPGLDETSHFEHDMGEVSPDIAREQQKRSPARRYGGGGQGGGAAAASASAHGALPGAINTSGAETECYRQQHGSPINARRSGRLAAGSGRRGSTTEVMAQTQFSMRILSREATPVAVDVYRNLCTTVRFTSVGRNYDMFVDVWRAKKFDQFSAAFHAHEQRDPDLYGEVVGRGHSARIEMSREHKVNAIFRACQDLIDCIVIIASEYQRSVIDYSVWYTEAHPELDTYVAIITFAATTAIVEGKFLAPSLDWDLVQLPM